MSHSGQPADSETSPANSDGAEQHADPWRQLEDDFGEDFSQQLRQGVKQEIAAAYSGMPTRPTTWTPGQRFGCLGVVVALVLLCAVLAWPERFFGNVFESKKKAGGADVEAVPAPKDAMDKAIERGGIELRSSSSVDGDYLLTDYGMWLIRGSEAVRIKEVTVFSTPTTRPMVPTGISAEQSTKKRSEYE